MNLDDIKQILDLVREHELSELEIERDGLKIRIRKDAAGHFTVHPPAPRSALPASAPGPATAGPVPAGPGAVEEGEAVELAVVKSPIVGTFYRSSEPGAAPFVDIGQVVRKRQVLCIIEAMKLMNEIESEYEGEIVSVYVENGQPVQYGERLFAIRTA
jgi:acetyl-CoA carboxylase biotin carboxyl carrier protein